jgi:hypothetical protein
VTAASAAISTGHGSQIGIANGTATKETGAGLRLASSESHRANLFLVIMTLFLF